MQPPKNIRIELVDSCNDNLYLLMSKITPRTELHLYKGTDRQYSCSGVDVEYSSGRFTLVNRAGNALVLPLDNSRPLKIVRYPDLEMFATVHLLDDYSIRFIVNSGVSFKGESSSGDAALLKISRGK